ncbi:MAG TPA: ferritin-like domain-containing protein, partial [Stellaceae bacterium]|nr:ferritin-like domain-containing protein [Stellaceae bacterium]
INRDWQQLSFVLERREQLGPYVPGTFVAQPFPDRAALITQLRYAAGVELAVMQEYLAAAWSLRPADGQPEPLAGDLRAAFAEIRRIAIGEMRHLRAVNDVLAALSPPGEFQPALGVASKLPDRTQGTFRPVRPRAATRAALDDFILIEAPSQSVDGLYGQILATLELSPEHGEQQQTIRKVMAEGEDHYETFLDVKEWLGRHPESATLRGADLAPPPADNPAHRQLQQRYAALLGRLYQGYREGLPNGAREINAARASMLGPDGIEGALDAIAAQSFLIAFDPVPDARFAAVDPP